MTASVPPVSSLAAAERREFQTGRLHVRHQTNRRSVPRAVLPLAVSQPAPPVAAPVPRGVGWVPALEIGRAHV